MVRLLIYFIFDQKQTFAFIIGIKIIKMKRMRIWVLSLTTLFILGGGSKVNSQNFPGHPWKDLDEIKAKIQPPKFPDQTFKITDYGAVGDGKTMNTKAFKKAITTCHQQGGGMVIVPKGVWLTGAIHLESNVNLHVTKDATILFSQNPKDYLPMVFTRFQGIELMNYSPFIYAYEKENIAVTGQGTLDGNADKKHWYPWKGRSQYGWKKGEPRQQKGWKYLLQMNKLEVPPKERIFGEGFYLRPMFIQFYKCKNILLKGITLHHSPMWEIHPVLSSNVIIDGIHIKSHGPNNDGIDPESSKNVWIKNCYLDTGDDCISIKSGRNHDGRRIGVPSENIIVENTHFEDGHGGIVIGSGTSGGMNNIYAQNLKMNSSDLSRVLRIKTSTMRGGVIKNIYLRNIKVGTYGKEAIRVNMFYGDDEPKSGEFMPTVKNIWVDNLQVKKGGDYGILIKAKEKSPVQNLLITNSTIKGVTTPLKVNHVENMRLEEVEINGKNWNKTLNK